MMNEGLIPRNPVPSSDDVQEPLEVLAETGSGTVKIKRSALRYCARCGEPAGKKCSGCKRVVYCGPVCQTAHWKAHKAACVTFTAPAATTATTAATDTTDTTDTTSRSSGYTFTASEIAQDRSPVRDGAASPPSSEERATPPSKTKPERRNKFNRGAKYQSKTGPNATSPEKTAGEKEGQKAKSGELSRVDAVLAYLRKEVIPAAVTGNFAIVFAAVVFGVECVTRIAGAIVRFGEGLERNYQRFLEHRRYNH